MITGKTKESFSSIFKVLAQRITNNYKIIIGFITELKPELWSEI